MFFFSRQNSSGDQSKRRSPFATILSWLDKTVYYCVGLAFLAAAALALGYSIIKIGQEVIGFPELVSPPFAGNVLEFVSDLLLVLIIMEVLGTVRSYLESGDTSVTPFLNIGIISATRGILSIGARLSIEKLGPDDFRNNLIELGVNALIIITLGLTINVLNLANSRTPVQSGLNDPSPPGNFVPTTGDVTAPKS